DEPRLAGGVDGDLWHPDVASDAGAGKEGGPAAVAIGAGAHLVVESAIAGPDSPDDAVGPHGHRGEIVLPLWIAEVVESGEPGDARARFGEGRADGGRLIEMRGRELRGGTESAKGEGPEQDGEGEGGGETRSWRDSHKGYCMRICGVSGPLIKSKGPARWV